MKYFILIFSASFLFYSISLGQRADFKTDIEKMNLKGKVQSIREISYIGDLDGKPIPGKIDSTEDNCLHVFQTGGNIISTTYYFTSGAVMFIEIFKYDTQRLLVEYSKLNSKNEILSKTVIEYDILNFKLKETNTDNKGRITSQQYGKFIMKDSNNYSYSKLNYTYNTDETFTVCYSEKGNLIYKIHEAQSGYYLKFRYFYNSNNQLIRQSVEKLDGKPFSQQEFEHDGKGNVTKFREKVPDHIISYTYEYNKQGDWIKRVAVNRRTGVKSGRQRDSQTVTVREIKYF